ncbi:MAG: PAS domain S-box protein, partial [Pseudomonadota bacterium]
MNPKTSSVNHLFKFGSRWTGTLAVVLLWLAATSLLIWRATEVNEELAAQQDRLVAEVVKGTGEAISIHLQALQRVVALLAEDNDALIRELASDPGNEDLHHALDARISRTFPKAFAFTLASSDGDPLLEDFEGLVGEVCRSEIRHYARDPQLLQPVVHPNPLGYHFDVMHPIPLRQGAEGIFFVSFNTEILAKILAKHRLPGYDLLLVNRDIAGLIEIGAEGGRDALEREIRLSPEELRRIARRLPLDRTRWDLIAMGHGAARSSSHSQLWHQTQWALGILGVISIAALLIIRRSQKAVASASLGLDEQRRRLRAIVETVAEAIVTIDERGVIETFNPSAERIFAYQAAEVVGQNVNMLMPEPYRSEHDGYLARYLTTGEARVIGVSLEVTGQRKDGSTFPMEVKVSDSEVGGRRFFTAAIHDITVQKEIERMKNEFIS